MRASLLRLLSGVMASFNRSNKTVYAAPGRIKRGRQGEQEEVEAMRLQQRYEKGG